MPSEESTAGADRHLGRVVDELKRELEAKSRELAEALGSNKPPQQGS